MIEIVTIVLFLAYILLWRWLLRRNDSEHCLWWHNIYGRYRVRYPDTERHKGGLSQRFTLKVAQDYAKIFGGEVVKDDETR